MSQAERFYANLFVQLLAVLLLSFYVFMTFPTNPMNIYWFIGSLLLMVYGMLRSVSETLLVCLMFTLLFGGFILYRSWLAIPIVEASWNELIWLVIFPCSALLGGINRYSNIATSDTSFFSFLDLEGPASLQEVGPCTVEERFGYMSGTAFLYKLEEEVLIGLKDRKKFNMLMIEIEQFREYKRMFGTDQAQLILNFVAEWFLEFSTNARAQVGEAILAGILTEQERDWIPSVQENLENQFYEMLLNRPRREGTVKLKLKFGIAECPSDGIEARTLIEKARNELTWNGL
ncbi:diguanylate cyclase domain-containing protein [Cohnella silvisoli]|uniref:Diguanylate cyclase n=1 Tax=Cohnella silvisoli TaxID=2873699 RepID=A0ABV1KYN4_9BACL|nr:diguanylate cyclase [Cohnella silvisoli]MCD9024479.1 diguanylate cyclase [Cohnella silvisoli]